MAIKVFVTGMGIISSIGLDVEETYASLKIGKTGIDKIKYLDTRYKGELPVGEVKLSNEELRTRLGLGKKAISRTILLGMLASKEALESAGIEDLDEYSTGLISATTVGGMDLSERVYQNFLENDIAKDLVHITNHDCGSSTEMIADFLGIKDYVNTISTACSSSANAIMLGARLIKHGMLDRVVVGGTDALSRFTLNGFKSLKLVDRQQCQPFDANRRGLNLGEGAGYLVLESESVVNKARKVKLCELTGYSNTNDAYHQTASSPTGDGAFRAMKKAIDVANLETTAIDYVNVHGTGTPNNDLSEGNALMNLFGNDVPPFSSTKAYTGHTLGAAGGIEAVFSILALQNQVVFPNLFLETPIEEHHSQPNTTWKSANITHVLSNSVGFGGNCTSLLFSKS